MIGILGGMGPLATADFFRKVIDASPALDDRDHVPMIIQSDPRIPPRPAAIIGNGESPLPALMAGRDRLIAAGATALAMPCNTAHYWYRQLSSDCPVPFLSILETACDAALARVPKGASVGVLATRATLEADLYRSALVARGLNVILPGDDLLESDVLTAIHYVKSGRLGLAGSHVRRAMDALATQGAALVVLGCTELPLALQAPADAPDSPPWIDSTLELARACVQLWHALTQMRS